MNILSLDGGGARGIITIVIIKEIMDRASSLIGKSLHITDLFDFYCGSSVGTLIISALLLPDDNDPLKPKYNIDDVLDIMVKKGPILFEKSYLQNLRTLWGLRLPKYIYDTRINMYEEIFLDTSFGQLLGNIVFPAGDTISHRPIYFHNNQEIHKNLKVKDILLGTTAAPTYFPSKSLIIDGKLTNLIDSGCVVNNTGQLAFVEAINFYKKTHLIESLYELSIGTGQIEETYDSKWWGSFTWMPIISTILINFNSDNQQYELSLITNNQQIDRINPYIPKNLYCLDYPEYTLQYIELTNKWINENSERMNLIVIKILINKGLLAKPNCDPI